MKCNNYDCDGASPAVVEVVARVLYHDEKSEQVTVSNYCVPCMHLSGHDDEKARRQPHAYPGHYRRRRCTWLTTLVNGEVPA